MADEFNKENCDLKYNGLKDRIEKLEKANEEKGRAQWQFMASLGIALISIIFNIFVILTKG